MFSIIFVPPRTRLISAMHFHGKVIANEIMLRNYNYLVISSNVQCNIIIYPTSVNWSIWIQFVVECYIYNTIVQHYVEVFIFVSININLYFQISCSSLGSMLAEVTSGSEMTFLRTNAENYGRSMYLPSENNML